MAAKKTDPRQSGGTLIQFNLFGLIVFSGSLLAVSGLLTYLLTVKTAGRSGASVAQVASRPPASQPWGQLVTYNIELERPQEYVAYETSSNQPPTWIFPNSPPEKVRAVLLASGLTAEQAQRALSSEHIVVTSSNTIVYPEDDLLMALTPQVRGKLYHELSLFPENHYMRFPFVFTGNSFKTISAGKNLDGASLALVEKLLYPRAADQCFSDFEYVMRHLPAESDRIALVQALSRQSAVLVRLQIRPDTDVDKLLGYWGSAPGVRLKDTRPLLDALKRLPEGGNISLLYFLPQFARQRLYTFPMPNQPGDPRMDCHWSTMNFFNDIPDNRFNDASYTARYLSENYYPIAKPSAYGDLVFLLDDKNSALHSAVHIADDLVFTKNGDNYMQPWMLMHLKDLLGIYSSDPAPRVVTYRNKSS